MINSLWKAPNDLDHQLPSHEKKDTSLISRFGLRDVLVFWSTRVLRCSSRLFFLVAALFTVFIVIWLLPESMSSGDFSILSWSADEPLPEANVRIVVFGSPDFVGSAVDASQPRKTWTEELCDELNCTSHISLVPSGKSSRGLLSNDIYQEELSKLLKVTSDSNIYEKPALDYSYLSSQYPTPFDVPDLAAQVAQFLAMPQPEAIPRETLWIFTFGTWDIWRLAAMPRKVSEKIIDKIVEHMFSQAELLYGKSLDDKSIAYSDFWSNATNSQVKELTATDAVDKVDERKFESFRVLMPKLFDVSLTPGWNDRADPPFPNSITEQQRNAAELTNSWNSVIEDSIGVWRQKAIKGPTAATTAAASAAAEDGEKEVRKENKTRSGRTKRDGQAGDPEEITSPGTNKTTDEQKPRVIYAPYPMRNGLQLDPVRNILDAMTEEDMHRVGVRDMKGRGTLSHNDTMRFIDIWTSCVKTQTSNSTADGDTFHANCQTPEDHLFYDSFTVSERMIKQASKSMAEDILKNAFHRKKKSSWLLRRWLRKRWDTA